MKNMIQLMKGVVICVFLFALIIVPQVNAQVFDDSEPGLYTAPDNYIFFVDGTHFWIDGIDLASYREYPDDPNNVYLNISGVANFGQAGFRIDSGLDISQHQEDGDTLFMRIRSSSQNLTENLGSKPPPKILFVDKSSNDAFNFRAQWRIPDEIHTGEWVDLALPLPTFDSQIALDSAKNGKLPDGSDRPEGELDDFMSNWEYWGTWSGENGGHVADTSNEVWREFNWNNVIKVGIYWDYNQSPEAPIDIDKVWIGNSDVDLSVVEVPVDPLASISVEEVASDTNMVTWESREDIGSFNVYMSGNPITDVDADNVFNLGGFKSDVLSYKHQVFSPHPALSNQDYYYAVTVRNGWGLENKAVSSNTVSISTQGKSMPYIFGLTEEKETAFIGHLDNGTFPEDSEFDDFAPFELYGEPNGTTYEGRSDASAEVWVANGSNGGTNTIYIYAKVFDDNTQGGNGAETMAGTTLYPYPDDETWVPGVKEADKNLEWNYYIKDQLKLYFGTYFVDNFVDGTTHDLMQRGAEPDYMLALQPYFDFSDGEANFATGDPDGLLTRLRITEPSGDADNDYNMLYYNSQYPFTFVPVFEVMKDEGGNYIGWKVFMGIDSQDLLAVVDDNNNVVDEPFVAPAATEVKYMPFSIELYDKDNDPQDTWWDNASSVFNTPHVKPGGIRTYANTSSIVGIGTVAISGVDMNTSVDQIEGAETPNSFGLKQNYPNPFNPTTKITFSVPSAEDVTLTIYNTLGQRVATLVNKTMTAGQYSVSFDASQLSSGIYFYKLEAGNNTLTKKMTLIK